MVDEAVRAKDQRTKEVEDMQRGLASLSADMQVRQAIVRQAPDKCEVPRFLQHLPNLKDTDFEGGLRPLENWALVTRES